MNTVLLQLLLVIAVVVSSVSVAAAQWTTVASAGTVDETDLGLFETVGSQVRIRNSAALPATGVVRYNVVAVEGVVGGNGIVMNVRYRDNGADARALFVLREFNFIRGATTTLLTLDSKTRPSSAAFQAQGISDCGPGFDFSTSAYFVETTLTKTVDGNPALQAIQVGFTTCPS